MASAPLPDHGTSTSYSDPFYDRLDAMSQRIKRSWLLIVIVLVVAIVGGAWLALSLRDKPSARSASLLVEAEGDAAKLQALVNDTSILPGVRAHAGNLLVQQYLNQGNPSAAITAAERAVSDAAQQRDEVVQWVVKLSLAAALEQSGNHARAITLYREVRGSAINNPSLRLPAILGLARVLEASGDTEGAMNALEPLTLRSERGAEYIVNSAITEYWRLKRLSSTSAASAASAQPTAPTSGSGSAALRP